MKQLLAIRSKKGTVSFLIQTKTVIVIAVLLILIFACFVLSTGLGNKFTSPVQVLQTILGQGTPQNALIIGTLRLPRIIAAVLVGAALGVSGAILQGIIRNPLASPDVIGITGGASFAAVAFITYFAGTVSIQWLPLAAFAGAALVSVIIYLLAWNKGVTPTRLVLVGIGISAIMGSLTMLMLVLSPIKAAGRAFVWLTGSIYGTSWENIYAMLPWVIIFIPLALYYSRLVDIQALGDDLARGLGAPVQLHRCMLLLVSVALAGSAVAIAGAIGFIGLIAPHIARKLVSSTFVDLIPVSALIGSLLLLIADTVGRTVFLPLDIPAGVFTAGIGAPFFIFLLFKNRNK